MTQQPETLRLADALETGDIHENAWQAAAELRRLHAENEAQAALLRQALEALDQITDKVDGTGFNSSHEFDYCLDIIAALRERLGEKK